MARSWAHLLAVWIVAGAAYVLFAGQFSPDELVAAVACGLVASLWAASLRRVASPRFRFEPGTWSALARAVAGVPSATGKVALALLRTAVAGGGGELRQQAFVHGRVDAPDDAGRRAVAVLARSLAPDSFVVRAPEGEDTLQLHALVETADGDPRWAV